MTRAMHKLKIDGWIPTSANRWAGHHWTVKHRYKKADREIIAVYAARDGIPRATGRRRVDLVVVLAKGQRTPDADNLWKSTLDGLVACGLLTDDNSRGVELGTVRFLRGEKRATRIDLHDLQP
jgi:Holliday junction resolvase RusA-like endonuclease